MSSENPFVERKSDHWYDDEGNPLHKDNETIFNLADAKKLIAQGKSANPSVTTITKGYIPKPELDNWIKQQILLSSLTTPRLDGQTEKEWVDSIVTSSKEQATKSAEYGTAIHDYIADNYLAICESRADRVFPDYFTESNFLENGVGEKLQFLDDWLFHNLNHKLIWAEKSFANKIKYISNKQYNDDNCHSPAIKFDEYGYGGRRDMLLDCSDRHLLIDIKTVETKMVKKQSTKKGVVVKEWNEPSKIVPYDEWIIQLGAYASATIIPSLTCANLVISRNENRIELIEHHEETIKWGFRVFCDVLKTYYDFNSLGVK